MGGFFGIGVRHWVHEENIGGLFRSAYSFGASYLYTIGKRYKGQASDTAKSYRHIPYIHFKDDDDFLAHIPPYCRLVCVENSANARPIKNFCHFKQQVFLLGSETSGLPSKYTDNFPTIILPGKLCLNVATAGSLVMYDMLMKGWSSH